MTASSAAACAAWQGKDVIEPTLKSPLRPAPELKSAKLYTLWIKQRIATVQRNHTMAQSNFPWRVWLKPACVLGLAVAGTGLPAQGTEGKADGGQSVIDVGSRKQLFIDDRLVESSRDVSLTMNVPRRDGQVLIAPDQPWEKGASICVYSSVMKEGGRVRVWYDLIRPTGPGPYDHTRRVCYAESKDGLHFTKPLLNLNEVGGSKANNVVLPGVIGGCSVWVDPKAPPEHRYKTQAKVYPTGQFHMHSSPDGLRWKLFARLNPGPGGWDTQSIVLWDKRIQRYVLYTRRWVRRQPRQTSCRTVRRLESDDLRRWDSQSTVMEADEVDLATHKASSGQPPVDYYGADVFRYAEADDVYVMLAQAFWHWQESEPRKGSGPSSFDVRLALSRDGKSFRLASRRPFMGTGPAGRFDSRYVWAMPHPIRMDDELWIYYVGSNCGHDDRLDPAAGGKHLTGIGRAVLRLDGWVSADAAYTGGELTSRPLTFTGSRLQLNVDAGAGGVVRVEIQGRNGKPIEGFAAADADGINGNHLRVLASWRGKTDVSTLAGKPIRLRFVMRDSKLYAFRFLPKDDRDG